MRTGKNLLQFSFGSGQSKAPPLYLMAIECGSESAPPAVAGGFLSRQHPPATAGSTDIAAHHVIGILVCSPCIRFMRSQFVNLPHRLSLLGSYSPLKYSQMRRRQMVAHKSSCEPDPFTHLLPVGATNAPQRQSRSLVLALKPHFGLRLFDRMADAHPQH